MECGFAQELLGLGTDSLLDLCFQAYCHSSFLIYLLFLILLV